MDNQQQELQEQIEMYEHDKLTAQAERSKYYDIEDKTERTQDKIKELEDEIESYSLKIISLKRKLYYPFSNQ